MLRTPRRSPLYLIMPNTIIVWEVTGRRDLPGGGTSDLTSTVLGVDEAAARRNFERSQARIVHTHPELPTWQSSELTFTPVEQVEPI